MTVDDYIGQFRGDVRERLFEVMRRIIREVAPDAEESIAYGMPAYKLGGKPLVYFCWVCSSHWVLCYPEQSRSLAEEFKKYKQGKGSVQFRLDQPLPVDLVRRVVMYRVKH